jgi:AGZA family xanthine/uracil permease-like MFS transporter
LLERFFQLKANGTSVRTEVLAGCTTFLTMAYIIVVQPQVLSGRMFGFETGMDFGAVMTATCLSAALATLIMALYARYPIAQAPGMGENFFFVLSVIPAAAAAGHAGAWQVALGVVFLSGLAFLLLTLTGFRAWLVDTISPSLKHGMAGGIGLFIAFIGLQNAGVIVTAASIADTSDGPLLIPGTLVRLNTHFASVDLIVFFFGLVLTSGLHTRRVRGSLVLGILSTTLFAAAVRLGLHLGPSSWADSGVFAGSALLSRFQVTWRVFDLPPSLGPTFLAMDIRGACSWAMLPFVVIFLFMDVFDTLGTLVGVSEQARLTVDGRLVRTRQAMLSDAAGTVAGAVLGTTAVVTALLFLVALFLAPLVQMIGSYPPITAPALVLVGGMMVGNLRRIEWGDYSEAVPAFLMAMGIPLCYSISDGLTLGFVTYPFIKLVSGRGRQVSWAMYALALLLLAYFIGLRARLG